MTLTGLAGNLGQFIVIYISHTNHKDAEACKNNTCYLKCSKHLLTFFLSILHKPLTCEDLPMIYTFWISFHPVKTQKVLDRFSHLSFKTFSSFIVFWSIIQSRAALATKFPHSLIQNVQFSQLYSILNLFCGQNLYRPLVIQLSVSISRISCLSISLSQSSIHLTNFYFPS